MSKKTCHWDNEQTGPEITGPELQTQSSEMPSSETSRQDGSGPAMEPTDAAQRLTGPHSASSTQTAAVSPLSRTENGAPPPQQSEQVANELRLARLETEAQELRRLLGLEATRTGQGRTTPTDLVPDQPDVFQAAVVRTSREVGCQTDVAEVCSHLDSSIFMTNSSAAHNSLSV